MSCAEISLSIKSGITDWGDAVSDSISLAAIECRSPKASLSTTLSLVFSARKPAMAWPSRRYGDVNDVLFGDGLRWLEDHLEQRLTSVFFTDHAEVGAKLTARTVNLVALLALRSTALQENLFAAKRVARKAENLGR